jgi:hypothetical protein
MEPLTMFAATVGLISTIHLLSTAAESLGKGLYDKGNQQAKREDWYCFFQPSDLLGADWGKTAKNQQPTISDAKRLEQRRRQQANRPRLRA